MTGVPVGGTRDVAVSTTSATMQVMLSGPPPCRASSISCRVTAFGVLDGGQRLAQRLVADHAGQPVRAEQVAVARLGVVDGQVGLGDRPAVQRPQQQRALRVGGDVVGADPALVDQRLHQRVVVGDLVELALPEQVTARIADVAHRGVPVGPEQRGQRGAHALDRRVGDDHLLQPGVGRGHRRRPVRPACRRRAARSRVSPSRRWSGSWPPRPRRARPSRPRPRAGEAPHTPSPRFLHGGARRRNVPRSGVQVSSAQFQNGLTDADRHTQSARASAASPSAGPGRCHWSNRDPRRSTDRPAGKSGHVGLKRSRR